MNVPMLLLNTVLTRLWQGPRRENSRMWRAILLLTLAAILVRSLPYLAPIHASDLQQDDRAIEFRDRNGLALGTLLTRDQNHTAVVPLEQVSPLFLHAIIAAEDSRYYHHGPLDLQAIGRAIAEAIQARQIVSGASTITMQLARMLDPAPRTLAEKLREIWLSWRLAAGMNRDEILHAYINRLPMGGNIYGVEAAARIYFGVPARDLSLPQASLLAALPNDPTDLNPYQAWSALKRRQHYVLTRMVQDGYISTAQANRAFAVPVTLLPRQQTRLEAPHYLFWLANQLPADHPSQIRTSLDRSLQRYVESQVRQVIRDLANNNVQQAAAIVLDNSTGEVLAYVGSTDYFSDRTMGRNDGVQALRQPGSALKPFLYELALETEAIRPQTILADVPTYYAIPGAKLYSPTDYSETFQGPVRVRLALANSLNVPAVRVLERVGVSAFLNRLHELGFHHLTQRPEHYGLGLALGSGEVTLWELAHAYRLMASYAVGANSWTHLADKPLPVAHSRHTHATWALITDMLSDRHARAHSFGVDSVLSLPFPAAVKTGTSSDFRDTWTVGFTTDYTVAIWVGNFDGSPMQHISGITGAAPLWNRIMLHLHENREPASFRPPELVQKPICAPSGMRPNTACPSVVLEYLYPEDVPAYNQQIDTVYEAVDSQPGQTTERRIHLPAEYNGWLANQSHSLPSGGLKIVAPQPGDYFHLLPSPQATTPQRLEFKLVGTGSTPVEWWLNGTKLGTSSPSQASYFWPLQPGDWTLEVRSGEQRDRVQFQVRVPETTLTRRGFSSGSP